VSTVSPTTLPPLRYLNREAVEASMPDVAARIDLAELTMRALVADAQLPSKIGVTPRPATAFAHAMPAFLQGRDPSGDKLGIKWVLGFATNNALAIPAIHAVTLLNDPQTGVPTAIIDAGPITAHRTAAVSGLAIREWGPRDLGRPARVAIIGAGTQARAHLPVVALVLPGAEVTIFDRHPERSAAIADEAAGVADVGAARAARSAREATGDADVVITAASFGPVKQVMSGDWLSPDATVVAVDYGMHASAALAREVGLFLTDDVGQFIKNRDVGEFDDYPDPHATIGEALIAGTKRPPTGRVLIVHLGVGLADVVFADAILRNAAAANHGMTLPR
jgi:ornithine cyclodeaminase/alanine dehydrogenase-like protein (mu-crystallin family)